MDPKDLGHFQCQGAYEVIIFCACGVVAGLLTLHSRPSSFHNDNDYHLRIFSNRATAYTGFHVLDMVILAPLQPLCSSVCSHVVHVVELN